MEKYYRPVTAFLTLENEEGLNRAKNYDEAVSVDNQYDDIRTLLGEPLKIDDAAEPTDIIWENRRFTTWERTKRTLIVIGVIVFLLFCSFIIIFSLSLKNSQITNQYPTTQCPSVEQIFGAQLPNMVKSEQHAAEGNEDMVYTYLPCFCKDSFKTYPTDKNDYNELKGYCDSYNTAALLAKVLSLGVSIAIVVINIILRLILISLIKWIGEDTHSQQLKSITNGIFVT